MASNRKAIRAKLVELLSGQTSVLTRVYPNRVRDLWDSNLPCILVWTKDEPAEIFNAAPLELRRNLKIVTEIIAEANESVDDTMDDIAEQVENILARNPRLDELASDCILESTEMDLDHTGKTLVGSMKLTWNVPHNKYFPEYDEELLGDFKSFHADVDVAPKDGRVEMEIQGTTFLNRYSTRFRGSNYISCPVTDDWTLTQISLSAWVKPDNVTDAMQIAAHHDNASVKKGFGFGIGMVTPGKLGFFSANTLEPAYTEDSGAVLTADVWTFVTITYDGANVKFYKNGTLSSTVARTQAIGESTMPFRIGSDTNSPSGSKFEGLINNLAIWGTALTQSEVTEIYNSGDPADLAIHSANANLRAWFRLGEGDSVFRAVDSENTNDGSKIAFEANDIVSDVP